eukprot:scaffold3330_cov398-Pinguiococcus_pyrenoidosus.AAC.9
MLSTPPLTDSTTVPLPSSGTPHLCSPASKRGNSAAFVLLCHLEARGVARSRLRGGRAARAAQVSNQMAVLSCSLIHVGKEVEIWP